MQKLLNLVFIIFLTSCANQKYKRIKKEYNEGNISLNAVLNLARTSYLKGCQENSNKDFEDCKNKASKHTENIAEILTAE
jgi:hypothetical protein